MSWQKTGHGEHITWHVREFVTLHRETGKISWAAIGAVTVEDAKDFVSSVNEAIELAGGETLEGLIAWAWDTPGVVFESDDDGYSVWKTADGSPFSGLLSSETSLFTALSEAKAKLMEGK